MWILVLGVGVVLEASDAEARLYIDITSPSMRRISIAVPDFKCLGHKNEHPELGSKLAGIISNDCDLSGYFRPLDKGSFIEGPGAGITRDSINFKDWSVIGAELLLKAGYECIGQQLKVEARLFEVFSGNQVYGKRILGLVEQSRYLMHRLANDILFALTRHPGPFLTKIAFVGTSTGQKEIYLADYDGHNLKQTTSHNTITLSPRFSPSGDRMIYTSFRDSGTVLFMYDMIKGGTKKISDREGLNIAAAWRPNGKELALTLTISGNPDIYLIDTTGKIVKRLTKNWGIDVSPTFSPDGEKMAFVSNRSGSPQIYILDLRNERVERLTFEGMKEAIIARLHGQSSTGLLLLVPQMGALISTPFLQMEVICGELPRVRVTMKTHVGLLTDGTLRSVQTEQTEITIFLSPMPMEKTRGR
jgi:TolB protein